MLYRLLHVASSVGAFELHATSWCTSIDTLQLATSGIGHIDLAVVESIDLDYDETVPLPLEAGDECLDRGYLEGLFRMHTSADDLSEYAALQRCGHEDTSIRRALATMFAGHVTRVKPRLLSHLLHRAVAQANKARRAEERARRREGQGCMG